MKKSDRKLIDALRSLGNVSEFCRKHGLPLRTVMRIKKGGAPNTMTAIALKQALDKE